jgi:uncharacterized protein (DUF433 family)
MGIVEDSEMGGDARIEGHRIGVYHIQQFADAGFSLEEIADEFDLLVDEVEEALEYASENDVSILLFRERDTPFLFANIRHS